MTDRDSAEGRGRGAAAGAFFGIVAVGLAYAIFNQRVSERDRRRHGWGVTRGSPGSRGR